MNPTTYTQQRVLPPAQWPSQFSNRARLQWATLENIEAMVGLAHRCDLQRAPNDPAKDFHRMVNTRDSGILTVVLDDELIAMVACGYDGRRGYLSYVACDPTYRGSGLMPALLDAAETWLNGLGVPRSLLFVRRTDKALLDYYRERGYAVDESVYLMVKAL
jgi:ribosomal protein S18 acetylase RimI-like enzyme